VRATSHHTSSPAMADASPSHERAERRPFGAGTFCESLVMPDTSYRCRGRSRMNAKRLARSTAGREFMPAAFCRLNNIPKTNRFRGVERRRSAHVGQPNLLLSRLSLSAPEFHRIVPPWRLVGFTTDREFHPAPKVDIQLTGFYHAANDSTVTKEMRRDPAAHPGIASCSLAGG
jgi:hypothetical protein